MRELSERRRETIEEARQQVGQLRRHDLVTLQEEGDVAFLTPAGWQLACAIVRNHRLWELYSPTPRTLGDHVHEDAEKIEHVLGEDVVRELERRLEYAKTDPHGRRIPSLADMRQGGAGQDRTDELVGYGRRP
jgi:manganese/zinc/iron transport system permease protein